MEPQQSQKSKTVTLVIVILVVLGAAYVLFNNYRLGQNGLPLSDSENDGAATVVVENTPAINGVLPAPAGLPSDVPVEEGDVTESATSRYPDQNAEQLSVSYLSFKTVAQKYAEYKTYMAKAGYDISEGDASSPIRAIFGTKADANLSVVISISGDKTLVQLAYLLKSTQ
ncbi:MAG: hypothetical protein CO185_00380 [Candidatus Zambryskibacteria bacterium CG_4_9_14_3_um_filter_42_15]|uniref:Uncharacterized protein n=1 Tax=Candidatus Zambryskibacteria bacterium CG_4_9_14_3_um_filter_42_15 TaxID=1975112 RepID=A0A2M7WT23_9BACT|nr:MAG: hypothetical protein CO185_00380 [Candidatus Zambryskibacteria bacterium CG_4_9_14_3_um_filter_42_15]